MYVAAQRYFAFIIIIIIIISICCISSDFTAEHMSVWTESEKKSAKMTQKFVVIKVVINSTRLTAVCKIKKHLIIYGQTKSLVRLSK